MWSINIMYKRTFYLSIVISTAMAMFLISALVYLLFLWQQASGQFQLELNYSLPRTTRNVGELCAAQMDAFLAGLSNFDFWAITMLDASSKIPVGILRGNLYDFGNYDECAAVDEEIQNITIKGKLCWPALQIPLPSMGTGYTKEDLPLNISRLLKNNRADGLSLSLSLCIPDACKPTEIAEYLDIEGAVFVDQLCVTNEREGLDASDIVATVFFSIILFFMIVSTVYDVYLYKTSRASAHQIFLAFSVFTNGRKLLAVGNENKSQLTSLYGIRCLCMFWVVLGHRYAVFANLPATNMLDIVEWPSRLYTQYIQSAPISVDTFFFLSGMMISYGYFNMKTKPKGFSFIPKYYLHRYLRITPAVAALFFVCVTLWRRIGSGPAWSQSADNRRAPCLTWWWSYFLYVQNYVHYDDLCIETTWYLSADMQLFLISPFILLPIWYISSRNSKKIITYGACACLVLVFMLIQAVVRLNVESANPYMTHTKLSIWMMGFTAGIFLKEVKSGELRIRMNSTLNLAIWTAVLAGMVSILLTMHGVRQNAEELETNMFDTFHTPAWGLGLTWIIYSCATGYGGFVNWFLSLPFFEVISRLTYSMYLVHIFVLFYSVGVMKTPWYFSEHNAFYNFCGDIICTTTVAAVWTLAFESPVITIEKCILNRSNGPKKENRDDTRNEIAYVNAAHSSTVPIISD